MPIARHRTGTVTGTTATSTQVVPNGTVDAGELIVVTADVRAQGRTITVTDTQGNTYLQALSQIATVATAQHYVYYALGAIGGSTPTVTFAISGAAAFIRVTCASYTPGVLGAFALGQVTSAEGSSTAPNSGNVVTTAADEVLIGSLIAFAPSVNLTPGGGYSEAVNSDQAVFIEDRIVSATGTYAADGTFHLTATWAAGIVTFADTPVGGGGTSLTPTVGAETLTGIAPSRVLGTLLTPVTP